MSDFEIFLVAPPGLEPALRAEAVAAGFSDPVAVAGGVVVRGGWAEVWRANLELRGAARVLLRLGAFRVFHLAQLDKRARKFPWGDFLRADVPVRVEVASKGSRVYHEGAAAERIARAITEELGAPVAADAEVRVKVRIDDDLCTISVDTSGESLHKRGHKEGVGKAPMRENLAALFLRECGFDGTGPVVDPMCGSGTFPIEAAEIAAGLKPGRSRGFAFERMVGFDAAGFARMRGDGLGVARPVLGGPVLSGPVPGGPVPSGPVFAGAFPGGSVLGGPVRFFGSDRDAGAVRMAEGNAERAGVAGLVQFRQQSVSDLVAPEGPGGLVIVNPPYGGRIGAKHMLHAVYGALGKTLLAGFSGWRVGMVTSEPSLARSSGLPFQRDPLAVLHGGTRVYLYQTPVLR